MSFFTNLRAERLITEIKSTSNAASPSTQKAVAKLVELGPGAIQADICRAFRRRQERHPGLYQCAHGARQPEDVTPVLDRAGRRESPRDRGDLLGTLEQPQLSGQPTARGVERRRNFEGPRCSM